MHTDTNDTITRTTVNGCNVVYRGTPPAWLLEGLAGEQPIPAKDAAWAREPFDDDPSGEPATATPSAAEPDPTDIEWCYLDPRDAPEVYVDYDDNHAGAYVVGVGRFALANMDRIAIVGRWAHFNSGPSDLLIHRNGGPTGRHDTLVALGHRTAVEHGAAFGLDEVMVEGEGRHLTTRMALTDARCPVVFSGATDDTTAAKLIRDAIEEYRRTRIVAAQFSLRASDALAVAVHTGGVGGNRDELLRHLEAVAEHVERRGVEDARSGAAGYPAPAPAGSDFDDDIPF